jgi:hypothetical protein
VLSGAQQSAGLFEVNVIRRTDVHAGDFHVGGKFSERSVRALEAERFRGGAAALGGAEKAAANMDAQTSKRFEVRPANKSESDDGDGMIHVNGSRRG